MPVPSTRTMHCYSAHCYYQIILLGNRGTCMWTTCPGLHPKALQPVIEPTTCWLQVQCPDHYASMYVQMIISQISHKTVRTRHCMQIMHFLKHVTALQEKVSSTHLWSAHFVERNEDKRQDKACKFYVSAILEWYHNHQYQLRQKQSQWHCPRNDACQI